MFSNVFACCISVVAFR